MNRTINSTFNVQYSYSLHFTRGIFDTGNPLLANLVAQYKPGRRVRVLFVLDGGMAALHTDLKVQIPEYCSHFDQLLEYTILVEIPGGEKAKNDPAHVEGLLSQINEKGICRHSIVVVVGGGAVIDMVGYAAAIAHRGIQIIRIPTTVLSQNDAAVGVKNGINYFGKKNFIGTFAVPLAIINDSDFLTTLHTRDWVAGTSEAVKVALIKDAEFFRYLEKKAVAIHQGDLQAMEELIYRCAKLHMEHIAGGGDPFEKGSARPLDFGHWAAHKLEHLSGYHLRHGEAVAIGMALDVHYACLLGLINGEDRDRILKLLHLLGFGEVLHSQDQISEDELLDGLEEFREHLGGTLSITLPEGIGNKVEVNSIDQGLMKQAIRGVFFQTATKNTDT